MTSKTYVDFSEPVVDAAWLNDVDQVVYDSDGANYIDFTPAGTGVVARSAQAKMRERYSPEDTGAVGVDLTDDKAKIDQAITNLTTAGGLLEFDSKTYYCATPPATIPAHLNVTGKGRAHEAFYATGSTSGTVLKIVGAAAGTCLKFEGTTNARGGGRIENMSIYAEGTAAITDILRVTGALHTSFTNLEISNPDARKGIGLNLLRNGAGASVIYSTFTKVNINEKCAIGLQMDGDINGNVFNNCAIQGTEVALLMKATAFTPVSNTFNGCQIENTYNTAMEHEWLAAGTHIQGYPPNTAGLYAVKLVKLSGGDATTFNGTYFECGGTPGTYTDGVHGVLSLVPVVSVESGVTNTHFLNCKWAAYLLDRGTRTRADGLIATPDYWTKAAPRCLRRTNVATAIGSSSFTAIPFATSLEEDAGSFSWDAGAVVLNVLRAGLYLITAEVAIESWAAASDWCYLRITCAGGQVFQGPNMGARAAGVTQGATCTAMVSFTAGQTIKVEAFTGEATTVVADLTYNRLMVVQL